MRRWRKVGGGEIYKWSTEGQELMGTFQGFKDGRFGQLGLLEEEDGRHVTFAVHTALEDRLRDVKPGQFIRITYEGDKMSKQGRTFKGFTLEIAEDDGADWPLPNAPDGGEPEEDLPF